MNRLSTEKRAQIIGMLVEGNSINKNLIIKTEATEAKSKKNIIVEEGVSRWSGFFGQGTGIYKCKTALD